MEIMEEYELVFIPGPGMGHIVAAVEFAKLIINRDLRLSITFLLINDPQIHKYNQSLHELANHRLKFLELPKPHPEENSTSEPTKNPVILAVEFIESHRPKVKDAVLDMLRSKSRVVGFLVDMFCVCMIDVANEFGVPTYTFYTSSAAYLSFQLYTQTLHDDKDLDIEGGKCSNEKYPIPGFLNHVPLKIFPSIMFDKSGGFEVYLRTARRLRESKGILINTFQELESYAIESLHEETNGSYVPPIYPVGPILNLNSVPKEDEEDIIKWLDSQPASSVVFLCFGSFGSFSVEQIKQIAMALECSGQRFLWALRARSSIDSVSSIEEVLPSGFLERTSGVGKVIGWAPQLLVLSHQATGVFVSHCGWNSIIESLWFGVPMAAWPMYAEQQVNAFEIVIELGIAAEIKMDYRDEMGDEMVVSSEEILRGIMQLMEHKDCDGIRDKVKDMKQMSKMSLVEGGSCHKFIDCFIHDMIKTSLTSKDS